MKKMKKNFYDTQELLKIKEIQLTMVKDLSEYNTILHNTIHNGITALFILLSLAVGAALPLLLVRKKSGKELQGIVKHKGE